jgi:hypothetical protein
MRKDNCDKDIHIFQSVYSKQIKDVELALETLYSFVVANRHDGLSGDIREDYITNLSCIQDMFSDLVSKGSID